MIGEPAFFKLNRSFSSYTGSVYGLSAFDVFFAGDKAF